MLRKVPTSTTQAREQSCVASHLLLELVVLYLSPRPHSTGLVSPKRYENYVPANFGEYYFYAQG
jgi:hypothetical protein